MAILINAFLILCLYAFNVGVMPFFSILGVIPNFLLIFPIIFAFETESLLPSLFTAFFSGLFLDHSSEVYFGSFLFAMFFSVFVLRFFTAKLFILERNVKNTFIIFLVFFVFIYLFVFLYNYYALRQDLGHLNILPDSKILFMRYLVEFCYSLPFVLLFRKLVYLQAGFISQNFYANIKKTF